LRPVLNATYRYLPLLTATFKVLLVAEVPVVGEETEGARLVVVDVAQVPRPLLQFLFYLFQPPPSVW